MWEPAVEQWQVSGVFFKRYDLRQQLVSNGLEHMPGQK